MLDLPPFAEVGTATSELPLILEVDLVGQILHNEQPLHIEVLITYKPPAEGAIYVLVLSGGSGPGAAASPEGIELCDEGGNPTGIRVVGATFTSLALWDVFLPHVSRD